MSRTTSSTPPRPRYEHRQTGWATIGAALLPPIAATQFLARVPAADEASVRFILPVSIALALILLLNLSSLTIQVTARDLVLRFGVGLFRRRIPLETVASVEIVRTRWYEGWGVHWTRRGTLYNVSGFDAVRLQQVSGKAVIVGSDDAARLRNAIDRVRAERQAALQPP